ncbi:hypothetical protein E0E54_09790 [Azotobacter chroococcum]|uniref:Uncharacterized protein n=1 Tax=Azotobacter chroococcum NCIMB 8003 TaxID=1328314 RepID=A0A0C4WM91_9GAMM|nr:hypothetical protein [Azotobacter chroococcum]AJE23923.1 Hypothetical protein Achr_f2290 [Azotobacter chroococcum NCIMB 8003]TBW36170.1 hypothetical protein E0E54_09790 [Azotobacter chroococcum]
MPITLDQLTQAVTSESLEAACWRQPRVIAHILRSRAEGHPFRDFAHGTLDAMLDLSEGKFSLRIRWEAEGQSQAEHGWICREAPHMNGGGIFSDVPILDEDGAPLAADADELVGLAYEFFSYQDIESAITPVLPVRPEPEFAPGPDADLFRPWHGRRKRRGR